ncbi:MAG: ATP-binding cassette domain-containing protein, partial [Clostridia bacterium]|nr:ATP-binding cassette domain-containing protein [Clostridia bacterium]
AALGLKDELNTPVNQLSGGMKRRVAIARALTAEFDCLILDEAFTGLDEENIKTAIKRILEIAQNKPIILISHSSLEAQLLNAQKYEL